MEELISRENIAVSASAKDWEEAIRQAGGLLAKSGKISPRYIDSMVASVKELGPYIVLLPGFALAHAAPSADVRATSMSLMTLKTPVNFGSANDPVSVVMCLACVDKTSHMQKLQLIAEKLMTPGAVGQMKGCRSVEELYRYINS